MGCVSSQDFYEKKIIQAQIGTTKEIFLEHERKKKGLPSFQALAVITDKFCPYLV
jgi:hypothetical protein